MFSQNKKTLYGDYEFYNTLELRNGVKTLFLDTNGYTTAQINAMTPASTGSIFLFDDDLDVWKYWNGTSWDTLQKGSFDTSLPRTISGDWSFIGNLNPVSMTLTGVGAEINTVTHVVKDLNNANTQSLATSLGIRNYIQSNNANKITLNGNPFYLVKNPGNNDPTKVDVLEVDDFVAQGAWSVNEWWDKAIYLGGNKDTKTSWKPLAPVIQIPLTGGG